MKITLFEIQNYPVFTEFWITIFAVKYGDYEERALFEINKYWHHYSVTVFFISFKFEI